MTSILTTQTKNNSTLANQQTSNSQNMTWDDATSSWDDAQGVWDNPGQVYSNQSKNASSLLGATKSTFFDYLLTENGGYLLLETGGRIILEQTTGTSSGFSDTNKNTTTLTNSVKN